jgi:hypothetical protein
MEFASMTYDSAVGKVVLFGGYGGSLSTTYAGTWLWDGNNWQKESPSTSPPPEADGPQMAYDPQTGTVVLNEQGPSGATTGQTWLYDASSDTWTESNTTSSPNVQGAAMAYDNGLGEVVLVGGATSSNTADATWAWNGSAWTEIASASGSNGPYGTSGVASAGAAYNSADGKLILFGGTNAHGVHTDTWALAVQTSPTWSEVSTTGPTTGDVPAMAYDPASGSIVLFGGETATSSLPATTWEALTAPSAPSAVSATPGDAQVALSWNAPSSDGGSAVTGYDVYEGTSSGGESSTAVNSSPLSGSSYTAKGLTNGTKYFFTVKAINAVGASVSSTEVSATPAAAPSAPSAVSAPTPVPTPTPAPATTPAPSQGPVPRHLSSKALGAPVSQVISANTAATLAATAGAAVVTLDVPAGALPAGTAVSIYPITKIAALHASLGDHQAFTSAFSITWQASNGTVPTASTPVRATITDAAIHAGDVIYEFGAKGQLMPVGKATVRGTVTITFTNDPTFVIAEIPKVTIAARGTVTPTGLVDLKVSCVAGAQCHGTVAMSVARKVNRKIRHVVLAHGIIGQNAGISRMVGFRLTPMGKALLMRLSAKKHFKMTSLTIVKGEPRMVHPVIVVG